MKRGTRNWTTILITLTVLGLGLALWADGGIKPPPGDQSLLKARVDKLYTTTTATLNDLQWDVYKSGNPMALRDFYQARVHHYYAWQNMKTGDLWTALRELVTTQHYINRVIADLAQP